MSALQKSKTTPIVSLAVKRQLNTDFIGIFHFRSAASLAKDVMHELQPSICLFMHSKVNDFVGLLQRE